MHVSVIPSNPVDETYRFLSILPMAHTYENTLGLLLPLMFGAQVYYLDRVPTPKLLVPAMQKIRPTVVLSVPLIIEKIYKSQVLPKFTSSKLMSKLYQFAPARKLFNRLAGKKLMETFGGELNFSESEVLNWMEPWSNSFGKLNSLMLSVTDLPKQLPWPRVPTHHRPSFKE